jgi:hypothetical protein
MHPRLRLFTGESLLLGSALLACAAVLTCASLAAQPAARTFASAEEAVRTLAAAVKAGNLQDVIAIFGPYGQELADTSDPTTARRNRETFVTAFAEGWHLVGPNASHKTLVIGNEEWPFPVPLTKSGGRWHFDSEAGKEEVIARRIGRNELTAIAICRTYVIAQQRYAAVGHDGKPAGAYATKFRSDPGKHNGLYWPAAKGEPRSPLGDLLAEAAEDEPAVTGARETPQPFHGYYFKILTGLATTAADGSATRGFGLVAWPARYDETGVMTFVVDQTGVVRQKDVGGDTGATVKAMALYNPDASWTEVR